MSLILEALKKSEAERQLGRAPGLMTPMPASASAQSSTPHWVAGVLLVVAFLAATTWWFSRTTGDPTARNSPLEPVDTTASVAPSAAQPQPAPPSRSEASGETSTAPIATPPATRSAPPPALRPQASDVEVDLPAPRDPEFESVERESMALVPETLHPVPPATEIPPPLPMDSAPAATSAPVEATPAVGDPLGVAAADLPTVDQLSAQERGNLPALKMSMHVFAEDPAARFVLIDGRRYSGGEQIAPSLRVVAIRRNGAELESNGRHFLLPRP